jgi:hypothetical protein
MIARRTISILLLVSIVVITLGISVAQMFCIEGMQESSLILTTNIPHAPYTVAYSTTLPTDESVTLKSFCGNGLDLGLDKQCYGCASDSGSVMIQGPGNASGLFCRAADGTLSEPIKSEKY